MFKCPFTGVVEIAPRQFMEGGVWRVEWPDCTASRQLALRQAVLRFPAHEPAKGGPRRRTDALVKRATAWEVVGGSIDR